MKASCQRGNRSVVKAFLGEQFAFPQNCGLKRIWCRKGDYNVLLIIICLISSCWIFNSGLNVIWGYAKLCLRIRSKKGKPAPRTLNCGGITGLFTYEDHFKSGKLFHIILFIRIHNTFIIVNASFPSLSLPWRWMPFIYLHTETRESILRRTWDSNFSSLVKVCVFISVHFINIESWFQFCLGFVFSTLKLWTDPEVGVRVCLLKQPAGHQQLYSNWFLLTVIIMKLQCWPGLRWCKSEIGAHLVSL